MSLYHCRNQAQGQFVPNCYEQRVGMTFSLAFPHQGFVIYSGTTKISEGKDRKGKWMFSESPDHKADSESHSFDKEILASVRPQGNVRTPSALLFSSHSSGHLHLYSSNPKHCQWRERLPGHKFVQDVSVIDILPILFLFYIMKTSTYATTTLKPERPECVAFV